MTGIYRIAELNIEIRSLYPAVHDYCKDYASNGPVDLVIEVSPADIAFEREKALHEAQAEGLIPKEYPDDYLEELAVYRRLADQMPIFGSYLFHGSAVSVDGEAYLFTAPSGTGKSTHVRLWREFLQERAVMINDDKPLIRIPESGSPLIYGTPYDGKHRLSSNLCVPLKAICLLERAEDNTICRCTVKELYPALLEQLYRPSDRFATLKVMELFDQTLRNVKLFRLSCNMDPEAAQIAYEAMRR